MTTPLHSGPSALRYAPPSFPPSQAERPETMEDAGQTPEDRPNLSSGGQSAGQTDEERQIPDSWTDFG